MPALSGGSFCAIARNQQNLTSQETAAAGLSTDTPTQLQAYFKSTLAEFQTIISKAPSALKPALGELLTAEKDLDTDLAAVGFNFTKVTATTFSNLNQPQLTSAAATIGEYLAAHCGIPYTPAPTS